MLPWFASLLLILSVSLENAVPRDLEVDPGGTVWVLSAWEPLVTRFLPDGTSQEVYLAFDGLAGGLALSPGGIWAVSCPAGDVVLIYDDDDTVIQVITADTPGDLVFSGLELWVVNTAAGTLGPPGGQPVATRGFTGATRLAPGPGGRVLAWGPGGVYLLQTGSPPEFLAPAGSACFTRNGMLLLHNGTLTNAEGDTLNTGVPADRLSSSPAGDSPVFWSSTGILVPE